MSEASIRFALASLASLGQPHTCLEVEWRLGHRGPQGFVPGVPAEAWHRLKARLDGNEAFEASETATYEQIDGGVKRVECPKDQSAVFVDKRRLADEDRDGPCALAVRASTSLELPLAQAPPGFREKFRRNKRRWSYRHKCWRVDLTRVRGNVNPDADDDVFEVEVELADPDELLERPMPSVCEWGWRLAADMCGLMAS